MKRRWLPVLLIAVLLSGCGVAPEGQDTDAPQTRTLFAMDTYMEFTVYGDEVLLDGVCEVITELEKKISVTDPDSELFAINQNGAGTLTGHAPELMEGALALCRRTDGALDISIYPVVRAWGFTTGSHQVPDEETVRRLRDSVDYTQVQYDAEAGSVSLPDGAEIDLGSVGKGYAGRLAAEYLRDMGVASALMSLGGNVQTLGSKPDGDPWRIAVRDPEGGEPMAVLSVRDKAVVTSGGYERYFEQDGETYWHIIDPATGYPANSGLVSVTIVGDDGLICDALSTALFVMGVEKSAALWMASNDFEAVLVTETGDVYITEGLEDSFALTEAHRSRNVWIIER